MHSQKNLFVDLGQQIAELPLVDNEQTFNFNLLKVSKKLNELKVETNSVNTGLFYYTLQHFVCGLKTELARREAFKKQIPELSEMSLYEWRLNEALDKINIFIVTISALAELASHADLDSSFNNQIVDIFERSLSWLDKFGKNNAAEDTLHNLQDGTLLKDKTFVSVNFKFNLEQEYNLTTLRKINYSLRNRDSIEIQTEMPTAPLIAKYIAQLSLSNAYLTEWNRVLANILQLQELKASEAYKDLVAGIKDQKKKNKFLAATDTLITGSYAMAQKTKPCERNINLLKAMNESIELVQAGINNPDPEIGGKLKEKAVNFPQHSLSKKLWAAFYTVAGVISLAASVALSVFGQFHLAVPAAITGTGLCYAGYATLFARPKKRFANALHNVAEVLKPKPVAIQ